MSDIEDYESEYGSDSEYSEDEKPIDKNNKNLNKNPLNIDDILGKDSDSDSEENSDIDENDEETIEDQNDDENQYGGADEISDEEDDNYDEDDNIENKNKNSKKTKVAKSIPLNIEEDSDIETDDEFDENYLQKFDRDINKNYIEEVHPECIIQNYDEVSILTRVVRDSQNIIIDPLHKTIPFLTKYEKARIIGQRAKQIESGAKPFIKVPENIIDSYIIAELELQQKMIPFIIKRPLPGGKCEFWNLKDLEIISF